MLLIKKQELIDSVPKRWYKEYVSRQGLLACDKQGVLDKLHALEKPLNEQEVNKIIGNSSWTYLKCDVCEKETDAILCIKPLDYCPYENRGVRICNDCMVKGLNKF